MTMLSNALQNCIEMCEKRFRYLNLQTFVLRSTDPADTHRSHRVAATTTSTLYGINGTDLSFSMSTIFHVQKREAGLVFFLLFAQRLLFASSQNEQPEISTWFHEIMCVLLTDCSLFGRFLRKKSTHAWRCDEKTDEAISGYQCSAFVDVRR